MSEWYVGQEVWIVPSDEREKPHSAKISKISRKWMTLDPKWAGQISKEDGSLKPQPGYFSRAKAWPSREEYQAWKRRCDKWGKFMRSLPYTVPEHMTDADLETVLSLVSGDE